MSKKSRERYFSWGNLMDMLMSIQTQIKESGIKYDCIFGIPRGGLIPAVMLSHMLDIPMVDYIGNGLYRNVLVVDDILDSGGTMKEYMKNRQTENSCEVNGVDVKYYTHIVSLAFNNDSKVIPKYYGDKNENGVWVIFPWEKSTADNVSKVNMKRR